MTFLRTYSLAGASLLLAGAARAQAPMPAVTPCTYRTCALSIAPRWNGLVVVSGTAGSPVANLNFFWPRDVSAALRGPSTDAIGADSAAAEARRALRLRRIGAALTDGGAVLGAFALDRALNAGQLRHTDGAIAAAGAAALGLSVPFQFAADGVLSRAVWWHNARYAGP